MKNKATAVLAVLDDDGTMRAVEYDSQESDPFNNGWYPQARRSGRLSECPRIYPALHAHSAK